MNTQINAAIKKLDSASKSIKDQFETIEKYTYEKVEEQVNLIAEKKGELSKLEEAFKAKYKAFQVDYNLDVKAHKSKELSKLLTEFNKADISNEDLASLRSQISNAKSETDKAIAIATNSLKKTLTANFTAENSTAVIKIATLEGDLSNAQEQIEFYKKEVERQTTELDSYGQRLVQVAQSNNSSTVHVGK